VLEGKVMIALGGFDIVVLAAVVLVILVLFAGIKTVPQGYRYTVERFGRYTRTLEPGLNLIVPFFERIGARMNVMEQVLDIATQEVITRDNASVSADAVAFYQVLNAAQAAYQIANLENAIQNLVDETAREKQFRDGVTLASYIGSTIPRWAAEAMAFVAWRDNVWRYSYGELAKAQAGQRPQPTVEKFLDEIARIAWPAV